MLRRVGFDGIVRHLHIVPGIHLDPLFIDRALKQGRGTGLDVPQRGFTLRAVSADLKGSQSGRFGVNHRVRRW